MNQELFTAAPLFRGIDKEELTALLSCMRAREQTYPKGAVVFRAGDVIHEVGLVLTGSVSMESDDLWGNRTILDCATPGRVFAETYACIPGEALMVNIVTMEPSSLMFLDTDHVLRTCSNACAYHSKIIRNLLSIAAQKNLNLSRRSFHTAPKSIRGRLLSYLSDQALQQGSRDFYIPFNRQQLADYLNVDRSAMSKELGKMHQEGLLTADKNHFVVSRQMAAE